MLRLLAVIAALAALRAGAAIPANELRAGFLSPPAAARPQTWWHWRDGDITEAAITMELEAMRRIGIGGVTMFSVQAYGARPGPRVPTLSQTWHERVRFALQECDRLGLEFTVHNCGGWSTAGGPWITPDLGMQRVVSSDHAVAGGQTLRLAAPPTWPAQGNSFYRDIALLAFPTPPVLRDAVALPEATVTGNVPGVERLADSRSPQPADADAAPAILADGATAWVQFEFPRAVTVRSLTITGGNDLTLPDEHRAVVLASDDGLVFQEVCRLSSYLALYPGAGVGMTHAVPPTTARFFRLAWTGAATLTLRRVAWSARPVIHSHDSKIGEQGRTLAAEPALPTEPGTAVPRAQIVDLTTTLAADGSLTWTAPQGHWTVLRVGHRSTGKINEPAQKEARGLECDKFNRAAVELHFEHYVGAILRDAAAVKSRALKGVLIDSWEARTQNWSADFRAEFTRRRGYDPVPYLPAFAGFIVDDREITDRFLRDVRQTGSDLVAENFYGVMTELSRKHNLTLAAEACGGSGPGTMVADGVQHYLRVDIPMTEFNRPLKEASSAAHLTGKPIVALEAFTQGRANWGDSPASLKRIGDGAFCEGVNRFVFHTYAHNPELENIYPGPAFGKYGLPFSRGQTWWELSRGWMQYLARSQFLLQRGEAVADVLYFYGEDPTGPIADVVGTQRVNLDAWPALPKGFSFDLLPPEILLQRLAVRDGRWVLPSGKSYRLLVLRDSDQMTPEAMTKLRDLVSAGGAVLGSKPRRSTGLGGFPHGDATVRRLANAVWGNCDGRTVTQHAYGQGRVFWGVSLADTLAALGETPDFSADGLSGSSDVRYFHRRDGGTEIYFISNQQARTESFTAGFRLTGLRPEIWDPVTGTIRAIDWYRVEANRISLPLELAANGSVFVVFSEPAAVSTASEVATPRVERASLTVQGPWTVAFAPGWGAPESIVFPHLEDWSRRSEPGIKYYSGTAVYRAFFEWKGVVRELAFVDLGSVGVIADVRINGTSCGITWTPPYRVEVGGALKSGHNVIEIDVANTWANRLIGEGRVPNATRHSWTTYHGFTPDSPLPVSGLLGPVVITSGNDAVTANRSLR